MIIDVGQLNKDLAKPLAKLEEAKAMHEEAVKNLTDVMLKHGIAQCKYYPEVLCTAQECFACELAPEGY